MLSVIVHSISAWDYYFTGSPSTYGSKEYGTRQTPSVASVYVLNCLFRSITSTNEGGALCCTSATYFLIESSSFFTCKTESKNGGAIYFCNSGSGQCVLHEVCSNNCCSTGGTHGLFAYIEVNNDVSSKNYFNYSSIARSVHSQPRHTLSLINGKIFCQSVNISMNECDCRSGIYCQPFYNSYSVTCSLSYSTFADNNEKSHICIYFNTRNAVFEIKSCNIIRNTQISSSYGTILARGNLMIEDSCILENNAYCIFYTDSSSYKITLSNCTVDSTSSDGNLIIRNTITKIFILALNHMSTQNCNA
jgi:hypothetical protein